jgi:hypothetical protein
MQINIKRLTLHTLFLLLWLSLGACSESTTAVSYGGVNYTDDYVSTFTINGEGGVENVDPHAGGDPNVCCAIIPKVWRPGLKATIRWQTNEDEVTWKTKTVDIPEYKEIGGFMVHFFPNDVVKVLVSNVIVGHKDYPYPDPDPNNCWRGVKNICKDAKK